MRLLLTGNYAAAHAVKACRVQVVAAYPITPQTTVVEKVAEMAGQGQFDARVIRVESEHSSMSACMGAAATGARVFTATSSQGLCYMHEMLHWVAGTRLPIVLVNVNRALAAPWNLGVDQIDSLSQRDTGWLQFYCESGQEVLDTIIQAYRIAETVYLPAMVSLDGFYLSHTTEMVDVPDLEVVDRYLPPFKPLYRFNADTPFAFGGTTSGAEYTQFRYNALEAMREVPGVARRAMDDFEAVFGRRYGLIECDSMGDAEIAVVAMGTVAGTVRHAVRELRAAGRRVGLVKIRAYRPFPVDELRAALTGVKKVAVIDRDASISSGGIVSQDLKAALYRAPATDGPAVFDFIAGLGGVDITPGRVRDIVDYVAERERADDEPVWVEVKP